ncbi:hypothetical protein AHiyo6_15800, partial [Arthrobacter sp. Hiyo6]
MAGGEQEAVPPFPFRVSGLEAELVRIDGG